MITENTHTQLNTKPLVGIVNKNLACFENEITEILDTLKEKKGFQKEEVL